MPSFLLCGFARRLGSGIAALAAACVGMVQFGVGIPARADTAPPIAAVPGQYSVSANGAAGYQIPISVPPGTAGMAPVLSLDYSSQSGDGTLGIGWMLSGMASIERCPQTLVQDNLHGGINYDSGDRFCFEGQQLVAISGTYGDSGTEYRTEIDGFSKIVSYGVAGTGPSYFKVWTKAGQVMEFGTTSDSRILTTTGSGTARSWAVHKVSDAKGNYFVVTYINDTTNGQTYPSRVDYTGNDGASLSPYNSVRFSYDSTRVDVAPLYHAGSLTATTVRLKHVTTYVGETVVSDYQLTYQDGTATAHSRLLSLKLCDGSGNCLPQTTFDWQGTRDTIAVTPSASPFTDKAVYGDFNSDGLVDGLMSGTATNTLPQVATLPLQLGNSAGGFTATTATATYDTAMGGGPNCVPDGCPIDGGPLLLGAPESTGDGFSDLFLSQTYSHLYFDPITGWHSGYIVYSLTNDEATNQTAQAVIAGITPTGSPLINVWGDFNGDGRNDYVGYLSNGNGTFSADAAHPAPPPYALVDTADFDGDGCTDVLTQGSSTHAITYYCTPALASLNVTNWVGSQIILGDFNGDGMSDILVVPATGSGTLYLSTGIGLVAQSFVVPSSWDSTTTYRILTGDWNGDGKTDIALAHLTSGGSHSIYLSTGTGFTLAATVANSGTANSAKAVDLNNDGVPDLVIGSTIYTFTYTPELMTNVTNGVDATTSFSYDRINENQPLYTKCPDNPTSYACGDSYPTQAMDGPNYVVSGVSLSNGLGACNPPSTANCYRTSFTYGGAKIGLTGRGNVGFSQRTVTDLQTNIVQTFKYRQDFPFIGMIASQTSTLDGVTLSSTVNSYVDDVLGSGSAVRHYTAVSQSVISGHDIDGSALPTTTAVYTYDCDSTPSSCFGNTLNIAASVSDGSSETTVNTYTNDTANWFLGRLLTSNVTRVAPGTATQVRQTAYCYSLSYTPSGTSCPTDPTPDGLMTQEFAEPESSSDPALKLETDYGYDAFGNRTSSIAKGCVWVSSTSCSTAASTASRETDAQFAATAGDHGQFPTKATNALSQFETSTFASTATAGNGIPAAFGEADSHTDLNGFVTNWTYDTFGRKTFEHRPDKTMDTASYNDCTVADLPAGEVIPGHCHFAVVVVRQDDFFGSGDIRQAGPTTVTYYDSLSRVIAQDTEGYNTGSNCSADTYCWIRVLTVYDANGRVLKTSRPYFLQGGTPKYTVFVYDANGRVVTKTEPGNVVTTYGYHGLTTTVTNDSSQTTTTVRNAQGAIASVQDTESHTTTYAYTAFGDLGTVTDPSSNVTTYAYDARGRKKSAVDPDMHTWSYVYDGFSELYSQTDAKSQVTTLTYDALGRVLTRVEPDMTSTWGYDSGTHGLGHVTSESATGTAAGGGSGSSRSYSFADGFGRLSAITTTVDGASYTYSYTYNPNGQIATVGYPSGFKVALAQTAAGYQNSILDNATSQPLWTANTRDAELHLLTQTAGSSVFSTTQTFDANSGRVLTIAAGPSSALANQTYAYDSLGNLIKRIWLNNAGATVTERACYDDLNRVVKYKLTTSAGCPLTGPATVTVSYDALGNIVGKTDICTGTCFAYGAGSAGPHALTSITGTYNGVVNPSFTYDLNGNMTAGGGRTVTSNSFNMAGSIVQGLNALTLTYDAEHNRVKQTASGGTPVATYYLNDPVSGAMEEVAHPAATPAWHDYVVADGHMVAERLCNGAAPCTAASSPTLDYFVLDQLGSLSVIADGTGAVLERLNYDPWGKRRNADGTAAACGTISSSASRGFTSQEMLDTVCFINFNARIYDPSLGRFLSADSVTPSYFDLQLLNRYSYVGNNPLSLIDPSGHDGCDDSGIECVPGDGQRGLSPGEAEWWRELAQYNGFPNFAGYFGPGTPRAPAMASAVQTVASGRATSSAQNKNNKRNVIEQAAMSALAKYNSGEKARNARGSHHVLAVVAGGAVMVVGTAAVVVAVVSTGGGDAPLAVPEEAGVDALAAATTAAIEGGDAAATADVAAVSTAAESAEAPSSGLIGQNFGKLGTAVENPELNITGFTEHGINQVITRGVSPSSLLATVGDPAVVLQQSGGQFLFLSDEAGVVLNPMGSVITAYPSSMFGPNVSSILNSIPK